MTKNKLVSRGDIDTMDRAEYHRRQNEQFAVFEQLSDRVDQFLLQFGQPDLRRGRPRGDYLVHGDYSEYPAVIVFVHSLALLRQPVVNALQQIVREYPGWHIDLMVGLWDHLNDWPNMGISIRDDEIVDDLRREYFPAEFRDLAFEGARRGSVLD